MQDRVIQLSEAHRGAIVTTLAAAFQNDPAISWMIPDSDQRRSRLPRMFDWLVDDHLRHGIILGTPDCAAVTMWRLPGKVHHHDRLWPPLLWRLLRAFGANLGRAAALGDAISAHVPAGEGYYYLRYAGVQPASQGQGLGGKVIRAGLALAAAQGRPACLETATPDNVGIYLRLGFNVVEEWDVPRGGPHFWTMTADV